MNNEVNPHTYRISEVVERMFFFFFFDSVNLFLDKRRVFPVKSPSEYKVTVELISIGESDCS